MNKIPYTNHSDKYQYPGGVCVPPGETRLVDEQFAGQPKSFTVEDFLSQKPGVIKSQVIDLNDEQLEQTYLAESEGKNRKTVIEPLEAELDSRKAKQLHDEVVAELYELTDEQLHEELLACEDETRKAIIEQVIAERADS